MRKIKEIAKEYGFDGVKYMGKWKSYKVYEPFFADDETHVIGYPQYVLQNNKQIRWVKDFKESMAIMDALK